MITIVVIVFYYLEFINLLGEHKAFYQLLQKLLRYSRPNDIIY